MRKLIAVVAVMVAAVFAGKASATSQGNPVDVEVWAQMSATLEITVTSATSYDFGNFTSNQQKVQTTAFVLQNTGGGLTQTYQVQGFNAGAPIAPGSWAMSGAAGNPGADAFAMDALFNTVMPAVGDFTDTTDRLNNATAVTADGTNMAGDQTGVNVPNLGSVNLWTRFTAPSSTGDTGLQRIRIEVAATAP